MHKYVNAFAGYILYASIATCVFLTGGLVGHYYDTKSQQEIVKVVAAEPKVIYPLKPVKAGRVSKFDASAVASTGNPAYSWVIKPDPLDTEFELFDSGKKMWFFGEANTRYSVILATYEKNADGTTGVRQREFDVTYEGFAPAPTPTPPTPKPPVPVPSSYIINPNGLAVLILEESTTRNQLPRPQLEALLSGNARAYLAKTCAKGDDGTTPEYRIFDKDLDGEYIAYENDRWKKAMKQAVVDSNGKLPWVLISNSKTGASLPMPGNEKDYLELLKKYGD